MPQVSHKNIVLLLEEDPINTKIVQKMLSYFGYTTITAHNRLEAGNFLQTRNVDIILMNIDMEGHEWPPIPKIADEIARKAGKQIPIIGFSDKADKTVRENCLKRGMDDYLPKPIYQKELCRVLHTCRAF
ncbi:MAG: response regulator [Desulfobacterales bacterium]